MKECANCGFHNEYGYCECSSQDKWYACPIENKKPENIQALKEYAEQIEPQAESEETGMNKPNNPKCSTCSIIRNPIRCWQCKYRTEDWERENLRTVIFIGEDDLYKPKTESEDDA